MHKRRPRKVARTLMLRPITVERLKEEAAIMDLSMNQLADRAMSEWLSERQNEKGPHVGGPFTV